MILIKSNEYIKNWNGIFSWGQDTYLYSAPAACGFSSANSWVVTYNYNPFPNNGYRPTIEVLNSDRLGTSGLKTVNLNLNGGSFNSENSINIVSAEDSYTAPPAEGFDFIDIGLTLTVFAKSLFVNTFNLRRAYRL